MAIGGMPMPIAPLAKPATMNAIAITAICRRDIRQAAERRISPDGDRAARGWRQLHRQTEARMAVRESG